jgi:hypothetical protein
MATITVQVLGSVIPQLPNDPWGRDGIDHAGIFGPAGANLVGDAFFVNWTGSDCLCANQGSNNQAPNPVFDAVLTINQHSFDFPVGQFGDMFRDFQQVNNIGNMPTLATG